MQNSCKSCNRVFDKFGRKFPPKSVKNYSLNIFKILFSLEDTLYLY